MGIITQMREIVKSDMKKSRPGENTEAGNLLPQLILQPQIIRDHGNKLRIRGLAAVVLDGVSEVAV